MDTIRLDCIFNPLPLLYAAWLIYCNKKGKRNVLSYVNLAALAAFLLFMPLCPQSFNVATYLLVLTLLVRAMSQAHFTYHQSVQRNRRNQKILNVQSNQQRQKR